MATEIIEALADSWMEAGDVTSNKGSGSNILIHDVGGPGKMRAILSFSLSTIPSGATISSATLVFQYSGRSGDPEGKKVNLYKVTRPTWVESEVTWNNYSSGNSWTTPGGDYVTSNPSGAELTIPASFNNWEVDIQTLLQEAIDNSQDLHLIMIFEDEGVSGNLLVQAYSKEAPGKNPPTLTVVYSGIYPLDALTRVTSITYRYNRGVYSTEVGLGGVISDFDIPVVDDAPPKSYLSKLPRDSKLPPTPKPGEEEGIPVPSMEETEQERRARLLGEIGIGTPAPPVEGETEQERRARLLEPIVRTTPTPNLTRRVIESEQEKRARLLGELGIGG